MSEENTSPDRFRVVATLDDGSTHTFHNLPADAALDAVRFFVTRDGDGLTFMPDDGSGMVFYPWERVASCAVEASVREAAKETLA